jgi:hypothetical protein
MNDTGGKAAGGFFENTKGALERRAFWFLKYTFSAERPKPR